jgi:ribosomal protein S1
MVEEWSASAAGEPDASRDQGDVAPPDGTEAAGGAWSPMEASAGAEGVELQGEEAVAPAPSPEPAAPESEAGGEEMPSIPEMHPGELVEGVVVQVQPDHIMVDVGYKTEGIVPVAELALPAGRTVDECFAQGQSVSVVVLSVDGQEGELVLSQRRGAEARAWDRLEEAHQAGEVITAPVVEEVKGGLVVDVGLRGFMPASHVERGYVNDLSVYVGQPVRARVIEIDRGKNRVILSQKVVLEEEHRRLRERTWADLQEGQVRRGVVKGLTDFGAFVDLGGVDGLLHVSEMAWGRVDHPSDVLAVGDEINVKILRLDREKEKISLGLKQVLPDPWETAEQRYPAGGVFEGKVMRLAPFGAFVQLEPGIEGLVHISQLADYHVHEPGEVVREGQTVRVKVLRVSPAERRVSLSIRDAERSRGGGDRGFHHSPAPANSEPLTLGDVFGNLFAQQRDRFRDSDEGN